MLSTVVYIRCHGFFYSLTNFWHEYQSEIEVQVDILNNIARKAAIRITKSASLKSRQMNKSSDILSHYVPIFSDIEQAKNISSPSLIKLNQGQLKRYGIEIVLVTNQNGIALNSHRRIKVTNTHCA